MTTYELFLLALVVWREARGETYEAKCGVAWSIRNRVVSPGWWGHSYPEVISKPWQYTSMTGKGDPNLVAWPLGLSDPSWFDSFRAAQAAQAATTADPVSGATHYFDRSLDANPPVWTKAGSSQHVCDIGHLHFWKVQ